MPRSFSTAVTIARPREEVFAYVSDPTRLDEWNSAVTSVALRSGTPGAAGSTYAMLRDLPTGRAENELAIAELTPLAVFTIRTTSGPTPFTYRYRFAADTVVELDAEIELGLLGAFAVHAIRRGVDANLATLKRLLESGVSG